MKWTYFIAFSYRVSGSDFYNFGNIDMTVDQRIEFFHTRQAVAASIADHLRSVFKTDYDYIVVINNWIFLKDEYDLNSHRIHVI